VIDRKYVADNEKPTGSQRTSSYCWRSKQQYYNAMTQDGAAANHAARTDRYAAALCAGRTGRREYNP